MTNILDLSGEALRTAWKESAMTGEAFAAFHGVSYSALRSKIYRANLQRRLKATQASDPKSSVSFKKEDNGDSVEVYEEGMNELLIHTNGESIRTLEQLIECAHVDLGTWEPLSPEFNSWESFAKRKDDLIVKVTLFQVKCRFIRRVPIKIQPVIHPVLVEFPSRASAAIATTRTAGLALFLPDPQFGFKRNLRTQKLDPFHDRLALSVALQVSEQLQPDIVVWGGDVLDLAEFSDHFTRSPEFYFCTQPAIAEAAYWVRSFQEACSSAEHYMQSGNHEERLNRGIVNHLMAAYDLRSADNLDAAPVLSVDNLLGLGRMGVTYLDNYPDSDLWINDDLRFTHGNIARNAPGATAKAMLDRAEESTMFGHIHRRESLSKTLHKQSRRRTINVVCPGCLCRVDGAVPAASPRVNWQQGIGYAYYDADSCKQMGVIPIENGEAYFDGHHYVGQDHREEVIRVLAELSF